jgi:hypothetical protein
LLRNTLPCNARLSRRDRWDPRHQTEAAIFQYINGFYNPRRRHSSPGFKALYLAAATLTEINAARMISKGKPVKMT